jgi:hypothetical protein
MWNWIKIKKENDNLPPFGKKVMLFWKKDGKKYATTGHLKSIDVDGAHWSNTQSTEIINYFNAILTGKDDNDLHPTHYCVIEVPEDEEEPKIK